MMYALNDFGNKILSEPNIKGICAGCNNVLIPKCGEINVWHWCHKKDSECDYFHESETLWHRKMKEHFNPCYREVFVIKDGVRHVADIKIGNFVVEFQNSPISSGDIVKRERFYGNMCWVFNVNDVFHNFVFYDKKDFVSFRWKWGHKSIRYCDRPVIFYMNNNFFRLKKFNNSSGWGYWINNFDDELKRIYKTNMRGVNNKWLRVSVSNH